MLLTGNILKNNGSHGHIKSDVVLFDNSINLYWTNVDRNLCYCSWCSLIQNNSIEKNDRRGQLKITFQFFFTSRHVYNSCVCLLEGDCNFLFVSSNINICIKYNWFFCYSLITLHSVTRRLRKKTEKDVLWWRHAHRREYENWEDYSLIVYQNDLILQKWKQKRQYL